MTKIDKTKLAQQKAFFRESMDLAGYHSYRDLAEDIVLSLPENLSLADEQAVSIVRRNLAAEIGGLASGQISPIYKDTDNKGKIRALALEVTTLLNVDPETLYSAASELAISSIEMTNEDEEIDDSFDAVSDINLIRRDICSALDTVKADRREIIIHKYIFGRTDAETAKEMGVTLSELKPEIDKAELIWKRMQYDKLADYNPQDLKGIESSTFSQVSNYLQLPEDFNASSFANIFIMNAARIKGVTSRHNGAPDLLYDKMKKELSDSIRQVENVLILPTPQGTVLSACKGSVVTSLLTCFGEVNHRPSHHFMSAVASIATENSDRLSTYFAGTSGDFFRAVKAISANGDRPVQEVCTRILSL